MTQQAIFVARGHYAVRGWVVPDHTLQQLKEPHHPWALCIPVINEGDRFRTQLQRLSATTLSADIIILDGGSRDGSVAPEFLRSMGVTALLVKEDLGGLSAQMRMGLAYAIACGYCGVVCMDGNNKDDPEDIPKFISALAKGVDHVQGSRFIVGGQSIRTPFLRLLAIRQVHAPLISWASGWPYTDTTNGFRGYSRRLLTDPRVQPFRSIFQDYELHYYLAIRAARLGMRVCEVPVTRTYPQHGHIPTKITPILGHLKLLHNLASACLHRFDPAPIATTGKSE